MQGRCDDFFFAKNGWQSSPKRPKKPRKKGKKSTVGTSASLSRHCFPSLRCCAPPQGQSPCKCPQCGAKLEEFSVNKPLQKVCMDPPIDAYGPSPPIFIYLPCSLTVTISFCFCRRKNWAKKLGRMGCCRDKFRSKVQFIRIINSFGGIFLSIYTFNHQSEPLIINSEPSIAKSEFNFGRTLVQLLNPNPSPISTQIKTWPWPC